MRIWQKIYIAALVLFLVFMNTGMFLAAGLIFQYNLEQEMITAQTECFFVCQNLEHDFTILKQNGRYQEDIIYSVARSYENYYKQSHISVTLTKRAEETETILKSETKTGGEVIYVTVEKGLSEPFEDYAVSYGKELTELEEIWSMIKRIFAVISLCLSVLLCFVLYAFMKRFFKPLNDLNKGVAALADGDYGYQITCRGRNEIAELSVHINKMAETIQRQMEALKEENEKKQQLMDNMAHELRTPLTSILGYAEYLQCAKTTKDEQHEALSYIMGESRRLAKMGEMMLSMNLYRQDEFFSETVHVKKLTEHVGKLLAQKLEEKKVRLSVRIEAETFWGEEVLLINLFRNLIENAVRASKEGDMVVWTGRKAKEEMIFCVADHGIGIEEEALKHITEPFYRIDKARSRAEGGVGLGLSVASLIVKKHGGTIAFASEKGVGTTVTVTLPQRNFTTS